MPSSNRFAPSGAAVLLSLAALLLLSSSAQAQYFGRNQVKWETFDWNVMHTEHYDIHFYPTMEAATRDAGRMAERWYARLSGVLQHQYERKPLILYASHPDFQQTNVVQGIGEGVGGVTEGLKNRVVLPFTGIYSTFDHVLGHELVHQFQYDLTAQPQAGGLQGMGRLPLWLVEGMAEYLSVGRVDPHTAMWLRDAIIRDDLPTIKQLARGRYFPYRFGQALWAYIAGRWGDNSVQALYRVAARSGVEPAFRRALGVSTDSVSTAWHAAVRSTYESALVGRTTPEALGRSIVGDPGERGDLNVSPSLSPDGRFVAFFSARDLFGVDLFLADAQTGRVIRRLASPTSDRHLDAISFLYSAGAWSPDGRRLAFIVVAEGDNQLAILDVESGRIEQRIAPRGVGGITDPAWSPDGTLLAFSGMAGGLSDLYVVDLRSNEVRQLTRDRHADIQPVWSPDGVTIAFVTDRGPETDFERLVYGEPQLALLDVDAGTVRVLPGFDGAKHINPVFSGDGRDLFFVSDRDGFSDIYRYSLADGQISQVTRLATGATGITGYSPAITLAAQTGRLMFSAFHNGGYLIYALEQAATRGEPIPTATAPERMAGVLPPVAALGTGPVAQYLADPLSGLPAESAFPVTDYRPRLRLDYVGGPTVGVAVGGPLGTMVGGGVAGYFSDMLGDRVLGAMIQAGGELQDIGGQVVYQNLRRRWNLAAGAARIPYLTGRAGFGQDPSGLIVVEQQLFRIFHHQVAGIAQYPFNMSQRFETSVTLNRQSFNFESRRLFYDSFGRFVGETREDLPSPDALNYVQGTAAFVGDNSFFGFTSPIAGSRYRFEASPTFGGLTFQTALADYRQYFFIRPLTLAFRGMHYGRYGADAESDRLQPLYVGYETLIRGYAFGSFDPAECTVDGTPAGRCPEFDRLIGSRLAIANAELRIPLLGPEVLALINVPFLPLEVAPFFDVGLAWTSDESPDLRFDRHTPDRVPVFSYGVSTRLNLLGYLILEMYYANPLQRPLQGWHLGFNLAPGW